MVPETWTDGYTEGYSENYIRLYLQGEIEKRPARVCGVRLFREGLEVRYAP